MSRHAEPQSNLNCDRVESVATHSGITALEPSGTALTTAYKFDESLYRFVRALAAHAMMVVEEEANTPTTPTLTGLNPSGQFRSVYACIGDTQSCDGAATEVDEKFCSMNCSTKRKVFCHKSATAAESTAQYTGNVHEPSEGGTVLARFALLYPHT